MGSKVVHILLGECRLLMVRFIPNITLFCRLPVFKIKRLSFRMVQDVWVDTDTAIYCRTVGTVNYFLLSVFNFPPSSKKSPFLCLSTGKESSLWVIPLGLVG
jgi:hypothetical protein